MNVIKNFLIYAFGAVLFKGVYVILAPIIMRILTPAEYGILSLVTNFIAIVFTCAGLGLRPLLSIEYFHCDLPGRKKVVNDIISIYVILMIPIFVLLFFGTSVINKIVFIGQAYPSLIIFCLMVAFFKFFSELFYQILQYTGQALRLTVVQIFSAIVLFSFNISFLYFLGWGIFSVVAAQFAAEFFVFLVAIFFYKLNFYHLHLNISKSLSKSWWYIKRGLPFIPRVLFAWILAVGDRWVLAKYGTFSDVGIYSVADMFSQFFNMVVTLPLAYSYFPYMMSKFAKNKNKLLFLDKWNLRVMFLAMTVMSIIVTIGLVIFKPLICIILPVEYHASTSYAWSLLMGQIFLLGTYFSTTLLHFKKCVYFMVFALCVPASLNIFLNILLVPKFAIWGCVYATVISYILYFSIVLFYNFYIKSTLTTH